MKARHFTYVIMVLLAAIFFASCENNSNDPGNVVPDDTGAIEVTDEGEFVTAGNGKNSNNYGEDAAATDEAGAPSNEDDRGGDASREIVEADIYKVEGSILYVLNQYRGLIAIDVTDPTALKIVGRTSFKGMPFEMYVQEGRAYVMVTGLRYNPDEEGGEDGYYDASRTFSELIVVDVADPAKQKILGRHMMEGTIIDSRQVGDVLYVAASENEYYWYYCDHSEMRGNNQITLMSLNIADPADIYQADVEHLEGTGYALYVTDHSIYVAETNYSYWEQGYYTDGVPVHYFDISDPDGTIVKKSEFKTRGYIGDRWKMHEKDGIFFAVTTTSQWSNGETTVEAFDVTDPAAPAKISDFTFMQDQQLYGARFDGNRLYAVTYFRQDPLHVIDITDPAKMSELGQLAVPGWSTHIEIRGTKLLTVGIDDQDGWAAKVSMYDVTDPANPTEMTTVSLGGSENGYSWSEATSDWKAFKIYDAIGLILVPTTEWNYESYRDVNKLHLIDFDLEKGLTKRGSVESPGYVRRGVVVGDYIASVGDTTVMMVEYSDRDKPEILSSLPVAYPVENLFACAGKLCGTKGNSWYDSDIRLATYDAAKDYPVNWTSDRIRGQYIYSMQNTAKAVTMFSYDYGYRTLEDGSQQYQEGVYATRFNLAAGKNPAFAGSVALEMPPQEETDGDYWYWYGRAFAVAESKAAGMMSSRYDYYCLEDGMPMECASDGAYDNYYYYNKSKLAVYDLTDMSGDSVAPVIIDKEFRAVSYDNNIIARGDKLWLTDCKLHAWDSEGRELLICYAQAVDVSDPAKPVLAEKYNIPGELVGMSDDGTIFYTLMRTWIKTDENGKRDGYYYNSSYLYHMNILKKSADGKKLQIVKVIPYHEEYTYTENTSEYLWSSYIIQDKTLFFNTMKQVYHWEETQCSYYSSTMERTSTVVAYNGVTGAKLMEDVIADGVGIANVDGGGILVLRQPNDGYYYYYYGSASNEYTYVAQDGTMTEITLPEASYYADDYYYYNGNKAVKDGDNLIIARGWEGLTTVSLKP